MLKLEYDEEDKSIRLGKKVWIDFIAYANPLAWVHEVFRANDLEFPHCRRTLLNFPENEWVQTSDIVNATTVINVMTPRQRNKQIGDMLGCSYIKLYKHWKALMFKCFVGDDYPIVKKLSTYSKFRNHLDVKAVCLTVAARELLRETYSDKQYNLLPFVARSGLNVKSLKECFKNVGKTAKWKTINKNSLNKNKLLMLNTSLLDFVSTDNLAVDTPTTLLKWRGPMRQDESDYLKNNFKGKWNKKDLIHHEIRLYNDTKNMSEREGEPFNPSWTPRRIREEHDRLTKLETTRKYSPEPFEWLKTLEPKVVEHEGYVATLLDNAGAIAEEGRAMGHCVGSYADSVKRGGYLVYSVTKGGERSSTIGITVPYESSLVPGKSWKSIYAVQQQYGRYNAQVTDENELQLAQLVVAKLNDSTTEERLAA